MLLEKGCCKYTPKSNHIHIPPIAKIVEQKYLILRNIPVIRHNNPQMISEISLSCYQPIDLLKRFVKQNLLFFVLKFRHYYNIPQAHPSTKTMQFRGWHLSCQVVSPKPSDGTQCWNHPTCSFPAQRGCLETR